MTTMTISEFADRVRTESKSVDATRALVILVALVPVSIGWIVGAALTALEWIWASAKLGFRMARPRGGDPT